MRFGGLKFCPTLWPTLGALLLFPVLLSLGFWQLERAGQKRDLYDNFLERQAAERLDLNREYTTNRELVLWRHITAEGVFDERLQILLDNQVQNHVAGYYIYTPFRLLNSDIWYLVNRGWVSAGGDRSTVPVFNLTDGAVEILAVTKDIPATGISLGEYPPERLKQGVLRVQTLKIEELAELSGYPLMPYVLRLEPESSHGYGRRWSIPGAGEEKHLGYAFQWFAMAAALVTIFIVVNLKRIEDATE